MRYTKITILVLTVVLLVGSSASMATAGLNPADPGLRSVDAYGITGIAKNGMSAYCVACHRTTPYGTGAGATGTHFVYGGTGLTTNSGGGWVSTDYAKSGERDLGQYFHIGAWQTAGIYSKYGNTSTNLSATNAAAGTVGYELAETGVGATTLNGHELICESCHNIVVNVAGGNNLVEHPGRAGEYGNQFRDSAVATLCVGCHGWMYDSNAANAVNNMSAGGYFDNAWNHIAESTSNAVRDSNAKEWKDDGAAHNVNHHMGTGDARVAAIATAYLNWSPTAAFSSSMTHDPIDTTTRAGFSYTLRATWGTGFARGDDATDFSCLACHAVGHGGHSSVGASILRGTATGAATTVIQRIGDSSTARNWKDQDRNATAGASTWCQNCHNQ